MTTDDWPRVREAFETSVQWFTRSVPVASARWDALALGEWTVRDLVGHTSRAMLTVEAYLGSPASRAEVTSPAEYFRRALAAVGDPAEVAQRGRIAGMALGEHPASAVSEIAERVVARLSAEGGDTLLTTPAGGMRLVDYLPTRTFELTVHTLDLAVAVGASLDVPEAAATECLQVMASLAARSNAAGPLLLAATGRRPLPAGFSIL